MALRASDPQQQFVSSIAEEEDVELLPSDGPQEQEEEERGRQRAEVFEVEPGEAHDDADNNDGEDDKGLTGKLEAMAERAWYYTSPSKRAFAISFAMDWW